jgi:alpha-1,2-rhamnosyltransferase
MISLARRLIGRIAATAQSRDDPPGDGNILLLLDSSWNYSLWEPTARFKAAGGMVLGLVYDLIPITHPHFFNDELAAAFRNWWERYLQVCDGLIAISGFVQSEIEKYALSNNQRKWATCDAALGSFHLGSELDLGSVQQMASARILKIFTLPYPSFLMVGSIEPRKNHAYVLDAFDQLWAAGNRVRLVIVGREAWKTQDVLLRIQSHRRFGSDLVLLRDVTDDELELCYQKADALIMSSKIEGFGLPIVEAFQRGLPVLCSDIPVFREIADGNAWFFGLESPAELAALISFFVERGRNRFGSRDKVRWPTWYQSTEALFQVISEISRPAAAAKSATSTDAP